MAVVDDATANGTAPGATPAPGRTLREIAESIGTKTRPLDEAPAPARAVADGAPAPKPEPEFNYETWYAAQPEEARKQFASNVYNNTISRIKEVAGDSAYGLLEEVAKDPTLRKKLDRLSDAKLKKFVFETAYEIYGDGAPVGSDGEPVRDERVDALQTEISGLKAERENEKIAAARREYETTRTRELEALVNEFPELRFDTNEPQSSAFLKVSDVIDRAEARSLKAGKVVSYRDVYSDMQRAWSGTAAPPRSAPATTKETDTPSARQAPKTEAESRARMRSTLEKHGGLTGLARALAR